VQDVVAEVRERGAAAHHGGEPLDLHLAAHRGVRHDLLGEHVERVAQVPRGLDAPVEHRARDHRGLEEVVAVLRVDGAGARLPHGVPRTADALQPAAHRTR